MGTPREGGSGSGVGGSRTGQDGLGGCRKIGAIRSGRTVECGLGRWSSWWVVCGGAVIDPTVTHRLPPWPFVHGPWSFTVQITGRALCIVVHTVYHVLMHTPTKQTEVPTMLCDVCNEYPPSESVGDRILTLELCDMCLEDYHAYEEAMTAAAHRVIAQIEVR